MESINLGARSTVQCTFSLSNHVSLPIAWAPFQLFKQSKISESTSSRYPSATLCIKDRPVNESDTRLKRINDLLLLLTTHTESSDSSTSEIEHLISHLDSSSYEFYLHSAAYRSNPLALTIHKSARFWPSSGFAFSGNYLLN